MKKTRTRHDIIKTRTILSLQINQRPRNRQGSSYRQHHISTRSINGDKVTKKQHVATFADAHLFAQCRSFESRHVWQLQS